MDWRLAHVGHEVHETRAILRGGTARVRWTLDGDFAEAAITREPRLRTPRDALLLAEARMRAVPVEAWLEIARVSTPNVLLASALAFTLTEGSLGKTLTF